MGSRSLQLQIRVTEVQKAAIRAAAGRAGVSMSEWVLARALPPPAARLGALAREVDGPESQAAWAEIIELLQGLSGVEFDRGVEGFDVGVLSARAANYLAALVEMKASQIGRPPPRWTASVVPLAIPWFGTSLRGLREYLLVHAPVAFRRRNIFIDAAVGHRV